MRWLVHRSSQGQSALVRTALSLLAVAAVAACGTPAAGPSQAVVDQHVARATQLAGDDLKYLMPVCRPQPATRAEQGPSADAHIHQLIAQAPPQPGQAFDNLYFVGSTWVSAWVLKTSEGLFLIDALNNDQEAQDLIEGGMRKLGLDPGQIKYVLITHGHGDHYGGAQMLAEKYGARLIASEADWKMMEGALEFDSTQWSRPPKRGISVHDGEALRLGDTTITFYITPGHTLGTISPVFDVRAGGQPHKALIWGGTSFNFGRDMARLDSYIQQTERMRAVARELSVDVPLSNHPSYDGTVAKLRARQANPAAPNPFLMGGSTVDRALAVMGECARAQEARFAISK
jgi:metallo-beta-lactamase class B